MSNNPGDTPSMTTAYLRKIMGEMKAQYRRDRLKRFLEGVLGIVGLFVFMVLFALIGFLIMPPGAEWALDLFEKLN